MSKFKLFPLRSLSNKRKPRPYDRTEMTQEAIEALALPPLPSLGDESLSDQGAEQ